MTTVAIIGAGDIGGAIAHALATRESTGRVLLVDAAGGIARGKALDIRQAGAIDGFDTQLDGTDDLSRIAGCAVCVLADRAGDRMAEWSGEEGLAHVARLSGYLGAAPLVFAGCTQAPLLLAAAREEGLGRERLIGSAPEALASAVRSIVAMEARCSPREVMLTVLGAPPDGFVVPWSVASIGGFALETVLTHVQIRRVEARAARLWPLGPHALGLAAATTAEALLRSSRRAFSVLTALDGEFGARGCVGTVPALLTPRGITHTRTPTLGTRERVRLETALNAGR